MRKTLLHSGKLKACLCVLALLVSSVCQPLSAGAVVISPSADPISGGKDENIAVDPTGKGDGYSAVLYDSKTGLPTSEANDIAETSEGFIWIGSYSGLIRYDGNTFERVDSTTGIVSVVSLFVDSRDRLWIGTNDNGVAVMEHGEFRIYNKKDGLKSSSVRSITETADGSIYIATTHGMVVVGDDMELRNVDEPQINEEYIKVIKTGIDDTIYGITLDGAVFTIKDGKLTGFYDGDKMGIKDIQSIQPDEKDSGYVYIGTKGSDVYYGKLDDGLKERKIIDTSPVEYINSIEHIHDRIWVCADNGVGIIEKDGIETLDNTPMSSSAESMMTDYQGNLWFTSSKQGVMKVVPNRFTDIFQKYALPPAVINTTCLYDNKLFIGGKNTGLTVIDKDGVKEKMPLDEVVTVSGKKLDYTDLTDMFEGGRIRSIIRDSRNRLWISTFGELGLVCYEDGKAVCYTKEDGMPSERVRTIYEREDGVIMAACTGGLVLIENDKISDIYNEDSGISNTEVLTAVEGFSGEMIIGTDGGGMYVIDGTKIEHLGTESGLKSEVVMRIKKSSSKDIYWIVTSNSIAYMDSDHKITTIEKFPYSNNFDVYENSKGELWVLSSNGIYISKIDDLLKNESISYTFYGMDNGLNCISTSNSYSELSSDGTLYLAGTTGISKVNIEESFENVGEVAMAVPYVEADGVRIYPDETGKMTVPSSAKKLTVYSFVYNYSLINPQVTYYLKGFENEKTTVKRSELVPVDYTNLKGGRYKFVMHIEDPQGEGSNDLSVVIVKKKSFCEKVWFRLMILAISAFCVYMVVDFIIKMKTKSLLKKEQENKLLIHEIVQAFAKVIDMKDEYTRGHSFRVAEYTAMLTKELGYDDETVEKYYNIALLHDVGKIGVPSEVLNKPGKLTDEEFRIIKSHPSLGYNVLKDISIMPELAIGAGSHHERPDGKGYPEGLAGDAIPRVAQIIAVADAFDAMYSDRPYRKRMNFEKVVSIMKECSGTQLKDDVVEAFLKLVEKGEFRAPDDDGGGTTENIDNIHKKFEQEAKAAEAKKNNFSENK